MGTNGKQNRNAPYPHGSLLLPMERYLDFCPPKMIKQHFCPVLPLVYFPSTGNSRNLFKRSQNSTYLDKLLISISVLIHSLPPPNSFHIYLLSCLCQGVWDIIPGVLTARESWYHGKHSAWLAGTGLLLTYFAKFLNVTGFPSAVNKHKGLDQGLQSILQSPSYCRAQTTQKEKEGSSAELAA